MNTLEIDVPEVRPERLGFLRSGKVGDKVVVTNDAGEWVLLDPEDHRVLLAGDLGPEHPLHEELSSRGFLRPTLDLDALAERVGRKRAFLGAGPHLHVIVTTLRCNQSCRYCHASRADMDRVETDMSLETARKAVDIAMRTPNPVVAFEFQGGEPTVNWEVLRFVVEYSREKNRVEGKQLVHSLVTNLTCMDEERAEWLLANDVHLCTSLDGPQPLHDLNRGWMGKAGAFDEVVRWMRYFNRRYVEMGRDPDVWHVDALMTTTRQSFDHLDAIIDLYVQMGIRNLHIRPLNPFGFATRTWKAIGYTTEEWLDFYARALDRIIELNLQGVEIMEGTASTFLKKMLTPDDPNFVDIRSPVGSGTGQVAYDYDGSIYISDEARMLAAMGDHTFRVGHVDHTTMRDILAHPTVRAIAVASLTDALPSCHACHAAPWCGVRPLHDYQRTGDLVALRRRTPKCKEHLGIVNLLLERLAADQGDGRVERIFRRWTLLRPRTT